MKLVSFKLGTREGFLFWCRGCRELHQINVAGDAPVWDFNGDLASPTFSPSHKTWWSGVNDMGDAVEHVCHSFITDGMIDYLSDCTHELSGQKVELPDVPESLYPTPEG